jgi:hypothetical protein
METVKFVNFFTPILNITGRAQVVTSEFTVARWPKLRLNKRKELIKWTCG